MFDFDRSEMWWGNKMRVKADSVNVRLYDKNDKYMDSVNIPTVYWPLNGEMRVFTYDTSRPVSDEAVLAVFDSVRYDIGRCYDSTARLVTALNAAGFDAKPYVGWLFVAIDQHPVHHSWVVLNGESVLDLADDYCVMLNPHNKKAFDEAEGDAERIRELMTSFALAAREVANSVRCAPVGVPTPFMVYVGSECDPDRGRNIYNQLIDQYPNHACQRNCDNNGWNATQKKMRDAGLMDWHGNK